MLRQVLASILELPEIRASHPPELRVHHCEGLRPVEVEPFLQCRRGGIGDLRLQDRVERGVRFMQGSAQAFVDVKLFAYLRELHDKWHVFITGPHDLDPGRSTPKTHAHACYAAVRAT